MQPAYCRDQPAGILWKTMNWCNKAGKINEVSYGIEEGSLHVSPGLSEHRMVRKLTEQLSIARR